VEIIFHEHHAEISERMRDRARRAVRRVTRRLDRVVDAVVRFEQDGPTRRVEIVLHTPGHRQLMAKSEGRFFGAALADVTDRLLAQLPKKDTVKTRSRAEARSRRVPAL
jgi:ribosome-associated translation inhibitor RaiA